MLFTKRITTVAITSAAILSLGLGLTLPAANAAETNSPAGLVLTSDLTPAPAPARIAPVARVIGIDANVVSGLSVTAPKGAKVTVSAKGEKTQSKKVTNAGTPVVFTKLVAAKKYSVTVNGKKVGTGIPVKAPGAAYKLTVTSTGEPTSALITWKYQTAPNAGAIEYEVTATPVAGQQVSTRSADLKHSVMAQSTEIVMTNLDPDLLYTFTVTPHNTAATGTASRATLPVTLGAAAGQLSASEQAEATQNAESARIAAESARIAAEKAAQNVPAPSTPAVPAAPVAPSTKTIYVCPAGFSEAGALCEKTSPYTYTVIPYTTYTVQEWVHNGWSYSWGYCTDSGKSGNWSNGDPYCQQPTYGYEPQTYNNATPAGYTDTGSAWIATAAKEAKVVPA